jgi:hypothetical protein
MTEDTSETSSIEKVALPSIHSYPASMVWYCDKCRSLVLAEGDCSEDTTSPIQPVDGDVCGLCDRIFRAARSAQLVRDEKIARELASSDVRTRTRSKYDANKGSDSNPIYDEELLHGMQTAQKGNARGEI